MQLTKPSTKASIGNTLEAGAVDEVGIGARSIGNVDLGRQPLGVKVDVGDLSGPGVGLVEVEDQRVRGLASGGVGSGAVLVEVGFGSVGLALQEDGIVGT